MQEIQLRDAKARLSALVDAAARGESAVITRHGNPRAVIVGVESGNGFARYRPSAGCLLCLWKMETSRHVIVVSDCSPSRDASL